jgi:hypothetical protein
VGYNNCSTTGIALPGVRMRYAALAGRPSEPLPAPNPCMCEGEISGRAAGAYRGGPAEWIQTIAVFSGGDRVELPAPRCPGILADPLRPGRLRLQPTVLAANTLPPNPRYRNHRHP